MKRIYTILLSLIMVFTLVSCSKAPELVYETETWVMEELPVPTDYEMTDVVRVCENFTNVAADMYTEVTDEYTLNVIECMQFAVAQVVKDDKLYQVTADNVAEAINALDQFGLREAAEAVIETEPQTYVCESTYVEPSSDDPEWGTRVVDGKVYPWPIMCASSTTGWETDDCTFQITRATEMEAAEEDLEMMVQSIEDNGIEYFKLGYYQDGNYHGIAWLLDGEYYISLATFYKQGSDYITLAAQRDTDQAYELAERYGMKRGMEALLTSEPYFEN